MKLVFVIGTLGVLTAAVPATAHYRHYHKHLLNDLTTTPGKPNTAVDTADICQKGYTSKKGVRNVPDSTKTHAYQLYEATKEGDAQHPPSCCEVDHLISLELGGSNELPNLWPEPYPDATEKDKVENALHALVCQGKLSLRTAQRGISRNWVAFRDSLQKAGNWPGKQFENVR